MISNQISTPAYRKNKLQLLGHAAPLQELTIEVPASDPTL